MKTDLLGGRYQRLLALGSGSTGEGWIAEDQLLVRRVAITKLAYVSRAGDPAAARIERLHEQVRLAAAFHHPHVVTVYDLIVEAGQPYLVTEFIAGESLSRRITAGGPIEPAEAARLAGQVAGALDAGHRAGMVHGAISPTNVMIDSSGNAKITGFGIAEAIDAPAAADTGQPVWTNPYLAPEVVLLGGPIAASDIWSLGATLYAAVEGRAPEGAALVADSTAASTRRVDVEAPLAPGRAPALGPLLARMLARDPDARPDAAEVRRALAALDPAELKVVSLISVLPDFGSTTKSAAAFEPLTPPSAVDWPAQELDTDVSAIAGPVSPVSPVSAVDATAVVVNEAPESVDTVPAAVDAADAAPVGAEDIGAEDIDAEHIRLGDFQPDDLHPDDIHADDFDAEGAAVATVSFALVPEPSRLASHRRRRVLLVAACVLGAAGVAAGLAVANGSSSARKPQASVTHPSLAPQSPSQSVDQVVPVQDTASSAPRVVKSRPTAKSSAASGSPSTQPTGTPTTLASTPARVVASTSPVVLHVRTSAPKPTSTPTPTVTSTPPVTAPSVPGAPVGVGWQQPATSNIGLWSPPADDGGAAITGYEVTLYDATTASQVSETSVGPGASPSQDFGCLNSADMLYFTVNATNSVGTGATATSATVASTC